MNEIKRLRKVLLNLVILAEQDQVAIDGEWGDCRDLDQLYRDGDIPDEIMQAHKELGTTRAK